MARHLKLRDNADAAIMGVGHQLANLSLCVILPVGPCFVQLGETLALDTENPRCHTNASAEHSSSPLPFLQGCA